MLKVKPVFISHEKYQTFLLEQLQKHYSGGLLTLVNNDWPMITKVWVTDLSEITTLLKDAYGERGPTPRDPASMMRSFLLLLLTNSTMSITKWVDQLYRVPLYAILSGFEPGNIPGVGTFYDFFNRLWGSEKKNVTNKIKSKNTRKRKPKKGKKGGKSPTATPGRVKRLVQWILPRLDRKKELPSDRLFDFFQSQILAVSANLGLLGDMERLKCCG